MVHQSRAEKRRAPTLISRGTLPASTLSSSSHALVFKGACDTAALLSQSLLGPLQTQPRLLCCSCGLPHPECPSPGSLDTSLSWALCVSRCLASVKEIDSTAACGLAHISDFSGLLLFLLGYLGCCLPLSLGSAYKTPFSVHITSPTRLPAPAAHLSSRGAAHELAWAVTSSRSPLRPSLPWKFNSSTPPPFLSSFPLICHQTHFSLNWAPFKCACRFGVEELEGVSVSQITLT